MPIDCGSCKKKAPAMLQGGEEEEEEDDEATASTIRRNHQLFLPRLNYERLTYYKMYAPESASYVLGPRRSESTSINDIAEAVGVTGGYGARTSWDWPNKEGRGSRRPLFRPEKGGYPKCYVYSTIDGLDGMMLMVWTVMTLRPSEFSELLRSNAREEESLRNALLVRLSTALME
ncbi:hypothetical protein B296_00011849 [Ensete ventricosum]|uniref:Uncharacterized protein n=1 Tax=Ensete ventricosum TaxID=4639 RepID=A0A427B9H6_ENSVE|nr:hypothetical protein B296_00011849 [Ensete ventricosum]